MTQPLTQAQQIAGYLKLTRAHYYLLGRHCPSPCLELRSLLVKDMSYETLELAAQLKSLIGGKYLGMAA
jgi:hypothetical protein